MIKSQIVVMAMLALVLWATPALADFFQYTNANGTVVMVDDESKVPAKYRKKMQRSSVAADETVKYTGVTVKNNRVYVPVKFCYRGNTVETTLLLDTGASTTVITTELANRLGIKKANTERSSARVADGRVLATYVTSLDYIAVGPKIKHNVQVSITPTTGPPVPYDGLLGMNFLADFNYHLDVNTQMINWIQ
jgi:clan AA aspartic protease (TIGR02281 family)